MFERNRVLRVKDTSRITTGYNLNDWGSLHRRPALDPF
jgi:hypothetical protein